MYESNAQRKFFHANRAKMEAQGVDVDEWDRASKGMKLPERAKKKKPVVAKPGNLSKLLGLR
jgi:hypothetical protein